MSKHYLTLLGRVSDDTRVYSHEIPTIYKDNLVLFTDYSPFDYPIGSKFLSGDTTLELEKVLVNGMFVNDFIPRGYKAVCLFSFHPSIPNDIAKLLVYDKIDYNSIAIKVYEIESHED